MGQRGAAQPGGQRGFGEVFCHFGNKCCEKPSCPRCWGVSPPPACPRLGSVSPNPKDFSASAPFPAALAAPLDAGSSSRGPHVCQCLVPRFPHTFGEKTGFLGVFMFQEWKEPKRIPCAVGAPGRWGDAGCKARRWVTVTEPRGGGQGGLPGTSLGQGGSVQPPGEQPGVELLPQLCHVPFFTLLQCFTPKLHGWGKPQQEPQGFREATAAVGLPQRVPLSSCPGCGICRPRGFQGKQMPEADQGTGAAAPGGLQLQLWGPWRGGVGRLAPNPKPQTPHDLGGGSWKWCQGWRGERRGAGGAGHTAGVLGEQLVMGRPRVSPGKGGPSASGVCVRGWRGQHGDSGVPRVPHAAWCPPLAPPGGQQGWGSHSRRSPLGFGV